MPLWKAEASECLISQYDWVCNVIQPEFRGTLKHLCINLAGYKTNNASEASEVTLARDILWQVRARDSIIPGPSYPRYNATPPITKLYGWGAGTESPHITVIYQGGTAVCYLGSYIYQKGAEHDMRSYEELLNSRHEK